MARKDATPNPPSSLAERGIAHVGLKVSSIERSRRFYEEVLGLGSELREPHLYIPSGGDMLVLYEGQAGMSDFHYGFWVEKPSKVDEWREWLRSKKIQIFEDITEEKYRSIKFKDPDGHWIEISHEK